ncbi:MAG: glycosyltransferase [bacterium]
MLAGSLPPEPCGVGIFLSRLSEELRKKGVEILLASRRGKPDVPFSPTALFWRKVQEFRPDILHLHYPGKAFRYSLFPFRLPEWHPRLLTLYEYRLAHPLRRAIARRIAQHCDAIIFPSGWERDAFPVKEKPTWVIPVFPLFSSISQRESSEYSPHFFFLGLWDKSKDFRFLQEAIKMGMKEGMVPTFTVYSLDRERAQKWRAKFPRQFQKRIVVDAIRDLREATERFSPGSVALLPFRDGCSLRRTSLLSLLALGIPVISFPPLEPPLQSGEGILPVRTVEEFLTVAQRVREEKFYREQSEKARQVARYFTPEYIAEQYLSVYNNFRKQ